MIKQTATKRIVLEVSDDMHKLIKIRAAELGVPVNAIVSNLILKWLSTKKSKVTQAIKG